MSQWPTDILKSTYANTGKSSIRAHFCPYLKTTLHNSWFCFRSHTFFHESQHVYIEEIIHRIPACRSLEGQRPLSFYTVSAVQDGNGS